MSRGNYGITIRPRNPDGIVLYLEGGISAATDTLLDNIRKNQTTLIDVVLTRIVRDGVFSFTQQLAPREFKDDPFGNPI